MNYKRRKTRRRVRCTLCTQLRYLGNNKGRRKLAEEQAIRLFAKREDAFIVFAPNGTTLSPRGGELLLVPVELLAQEVS